MADFITGLVGGTLRGAYDDYVGFRFHLAGSLEITHLGRWVVAGNSDTHRVRIINSSDVEQFFVNVNTSGAASGAFKWVALGSPVTLPAGDYACMSLESSSGPADQWYNETLTVNHTAVATGVTPCYHGYASSPGGTDQSYVPPNFRYTATAVDTSKFLAVL